MEITILDSLLRRTTLVDKYESFIWTERWQEAGDFELVMKATTDNREYFLPGTWFTIPQSNRVMEVETINDQLSAEGVTTLTIKGRSIEATIMENRVAMKNWRSNPPSEDLWIVGPTDPFSMVFYLWQEICVVGQLNASDIVANQVATGTGLSWEEIGYIPRPDVQIKYSEPAMTLYDAVEKLSKEYDLGFKIYRNPDTNLLRFISYMANNRTTTQTRFRPVVFSPTMENIQNVTTLKSTVDAKNVAYVFSPAGRAQVYAEGVDPEVDSYERRVLLVMASDITGKKPLAQGQTGEPTPMSAQELQDALVQRGKEALAKHRVFYGVDGELDPNGSYRYNIDYELGDLVELRNDRGATNAMRVTEQIFVSDNEGDRAYPTLSLTSFIYPGAWNAMGTRKWENMDLTEYWSNSP